MVVQSARLVEGAEQMLLYPRTGLVVMSVTSASPVVRAVTEPRPDDDGELDTTERFGARAVAVELMATETPAGFVEELSAWMHPGRRPYLEVVDDEWAQTRRVMLRSDQWGGPIDADDAPYIRRIPAQWRAPDGIWEASESTTLTVSADVPSSVGVSAPVTAPIALTPTLASGSLQMTNVGGSPSHFTALLYGPCSAPRLINDLTGEQIAFTSDLVLAAGEYVEIDTRAKTARLLSSVAADRRGFIDFSVNSWWQIQRGAQQIRYAPTAPTAGSQAVITYRPVWL
jgi:hypothetical protein